MPTVLLVRHGRTAANAGVPADKAGLAAGLLNASQQLGTALAGNQAQAHFRKSKGSGGRCNDQVTAQCQFEAATQRESFDGGNNRHR